MFTLGHGLESFCSFFYYNGVATTEGTGFWTPEASSGVVASIVLVSKGLDCPGMSLVEVCATCLRCHLVIEVQYLELDFHELENI